MGRPSRLLRPLLPAALAAAAAFPAAASCAPPSDGDPLPYFAQIQPSDSPLDVWCRLHASLPPANYKAKVVFAAPKRKLFEGAYRAERVVNLRVDPAEPDPRMQMARLIQSLVPAKPGAQARDANGQPFSMALEWVVQATAPTTPEAPTSQGLGLPTSYPGAKSYALWMPMALNLSPVSLFGQDFELQVVFRPHVTRLIHALEGKAERFVLKGAADKALPFAETSGCPEDRAPDCKGAPETLDLVTAWVVDSVKLTSLAKGGLSKTTESLAAWLRQSRVRPSVNTMEQDYKATEGRAKLEIRTPTRELQMLAAGDPNKASGTQSIVIQWRELPKVKNSYASWLDDTAQALRDQIVLAYGKPGSR